MAGKTGCLVGLVNSKFVHVPIAKAVESKKLVNVRGLDGKFQAFLDSSGMSVDLVSATFKWVCVISP